MSSALPSVTKGYQPTAGNASPNIRVHRKTTLDDNAKSEQQAHSSLSDESTRRETSPQSRIPSGRRRWLACCAVVVGILPFIVLEVSLRLFNVGATQAELHSGFGNTNPLFEFDQATQEYRTSLSKLQFFVTQQFPQQVAANEFRFFVLGGSTVQGRPFSVDTSFTRWLELRLNAADPNTKYSGINCGGISYASYRLKPVLQEVLTYQPDLIVLATGHNEFLEDRTYTSLKSRSTARMWLESTAGNLRTVRVVTRLLGGVPQLEPDQDTDADAPTDDVETRLDRESGYAAYHRDPQWHRQVQQQYADSVNEMINMCRDADVPIVLVRLGANLRDCPPFKSELPADLSVEQQQQWQTLFDKATAQQATDWQTALTTYKEVLALDPEYALVHFRIARCLQQLGRHAEAKVSYQMALDHDVCALRMTSALHESLQQIAASADVPLIDARDRLDQVARHGTPGHDLYLDHVHPTMAGHQLIAESIAERCISDGIVPATQDVVDDRRLHRDHLQSLLPTYFSNGRRRIGWLERWARRQRLLQETEPIDVAGQVDATVRSLELGDYEAARTSWPALMADHNSVPLLLQRSATLFHHGHNNLATWILQELASEDLSDREQDTVALASLILTVDADASPQVQTLWQQREADWDQILQNDRSGWSEVMPDVVSQTQLLLQRK
ncbi:MAG: tetratricopeptide repeat protein [Planctomycetaceae bacterium]